MAKQTKRSKADEYKAIMEKNGHGPDEWRVLSFVFENEGKPEHFHIRLLMAIPGPKYWLFDCFDKTANVVVPNDEQNAKWVQEIAELSGGHKTTPNLR